MIVVDFGAQLSSFQSSCWRYIDLSATGNAAEACTGVFSTLRQVELWKKENPEEVHLLLLPDLRHLADKDQVVRALWERLHRAASGCFIANSSLI